MTGKIIRRQNIRLTHDTGAAGLIYGYTGIIPIALWGILKWFGSESANVMECLALYGYANLIWIPVALVSWSPLTGRWCCNSRRCPATDKMQHLTTPSLVLDSRSRLCSSSATCIPSSALRM